MAETKKDLTKGGGVHKTKLDYNDAMLLLEIEGLARDGYDDQQIAEILDVAPETFSKNKTKKQPDKTLSNLSQALTRGRRPLNVLVENAMYKRAIGQTIKTKTRTTTLNKHGLPIGRVTVIETETELPGDVLAQWNWLKNRKADIYNVQPQKIDMTTNGKDINEAPRISKIEHVTINADQVKKQDVEV